LVFDSKQTFRPSQFPEARFRGGCTLLIDLATGEIRYMVRKKVKSAQRFSSQFKFSAGARDELHANYFDDQSGTREPFALMHRVYG